MVANTLIFMGTPEFAVPSLDALLVAGFPIAAVYCQPPRPAGRGKRPRPTAVQRRAEAVRVRRAAEESLPVQGSAQGGRPALFPHLDGRPQRVHVTGDGRGVERMAVRIVQAPRHRVQ